MRLTAGRVDAFACPPDKAQAFLWDTEAPALMLRATPSGRKTYAFEGRLNGATIRVNIGTAADWMLDKARKRAAELKQMIDGGTDPREVERQKAAEAAAAKAEQAAKALTVGDLWPSYMANGKPKRREAWKPRYLADLQKMAAAGGEKKKRGTGLTRPGPIFPLLAMPLAEINEDTLKVWHDREAKAGKHQAARALMMFRGFLRWCAGRREYRDLVDSDAGRAPAILDTLPSTGESRRTDALESAQVAGWWSGVMQLANPVASAYLRTLLLTGARREEVAALKWEHIDFRWRKVTLADKVGDTRTIPLSAYLAWLLGSLPRKSEFVFASASKSGRLTDPRSSHQTALKSAGIDHLTIHGLRRSFALLGEAAGAPAGAIAQVQGHRPSATAEGYKPRSIDALRPYVEQITAHVLTLAGVKFVPVDEVGKLRVVVA
ncbi:tyrosine-type recombinase/integrase [Hydrogenophaga atypica]|uniref:Tyrosine-type recombinase/integrase n=1 Tax=Hydrogenophaga atypica TaxID=249409 RepID=A0ABW2QW65_9BURK